MPDKSKEQRLVPLLIDVQRDLDRDIDLESLASRFGTSTFHFHRVFSGFIGETPKKHIERLRLEKAAYLLAITDDPVVDIGLAVGFKNPETFARNFRKFIGHSPSGYRRMAKLAQAERLKNVDFFATDEYRLSKARFEELPATPVLAIRRMGQYGEVNRSFGAERHSWHELLEWARKRGACASPVFIGLFYDDPTMTPNALQRCDVCVPVDRSVAGTDQIRYTRFEGGWYGIVEYIGRIDTILSAFRGLADEIRRSGAYAFRDGPSLEFFRTPNVGGQSGVHRIDACLPVEPKNKRRRK